MFDLQRQDVKPSPEDMARYVQNAAFDSFCETIRKTYQIEESISFSKCSMERGWNVKFKKSGKSLCTIYPREGYFTVLLVVGQKEKEAVEAIWDEWSDSIRTIYTHTREGNGQRWLMIDVEDEDAVYRDVLRLVTIRKGGRNDSIL